LELFAEVLDRIRSRCDMLVNLTTSGLNVTGDDVTAQRLEPVRLRPELCSLDIGSLNFRDRLFANPPDFGEEAARLMAAAGVKPEIEVFDTGHIDQAAAMIERGMFAAPPYFQLCMGVNWGIAATPENLMFMRSKLPPGAQWSVLGVGRAQLAMVTLGVLLGGHVRVGFEDNLYLRKGVLAQSNAAFVEQAVGIVQMLQREVATPAEARRILGIG
jgi:3-keto-5-aminohexanoate cleavage enzyme